MSPEVELPESEHQETIETLPIFPLIAKLTGVRLRIGSEMEYGLSLVTDCQPQINLVGMNKDRITKDQAIMVAQGIIDTWPRWQDLRALRASIPATEKTAKDWQK